MSIEAMAFDFTGVVADIRMALSSDPGNQPWVIEPHQEVIEAIRTARATGIATALITNNDRAALYGALPFDLDELFDVTVFSSDVGAGKPDKRIYLRALELLDVEGEVIYFDDIERNVDAATEVGMSGVIATSPQVVTKAIADLLEAE